MTDKNGNATTWQDNHSGLRKHKLMTKELGDTIPPLYANDGADDPDAVVAKVKLFQPVQRLALVHHRVGPRDRTVLRPRRGVRDRAGLFRPDGTLGSNRARRRPRRGARPVLGAADPGRDQETVVGDGGLASNGHRRNQGRIKERRSHA